MYQMYAYSKKYAEGDMVPEVWVLYPKTEEMHEPLHFDSGDGTKAHVFFVDVTTKDTNLDKLKAMMEASIK